MSNIPTWREATLISLASWRAWKLIAEDDITDLPRRKLLRLGDWSEDEGKHPPPDYRYGIGGFIACPWCLGFWISIAWFLAWAWLPQEALYVAAPLAISAAVGLLSKLDS